MYRTLQRALEELGTHPQASGSDPAVLGFSMGGHWAMWLAQHPPPAVSAVVLYYAARSGDFTHMTAPVLTHFAETDEFVSPAARRTMEREITRRGLPYATYDYAGTGHWFAEPDQPAYDEIAAASRVRPNRGLPQGHRPPRTGVIRPDGGGRLDLRPRCRRDACFVVGDRGFEPLTPSVSRKCSTPELIARFRRCHGIRRARALCLRTCSGGGVTRWRWRRGRRVGSPARPGRSPPRPPRASRAPGTRRAGRREPRAR